MMTGQDEDKPMTKERAMKEMQEVVDRNGGDTEGNHSYADDILCEFLEHLGHKDLVELFYEVDKWYA